MKKLVSVKYLSGMLNISVRTIWRLVSSGEMPAPIKVGSLSRWEESEIDAWLAQKRGGGKQKPT